MVPALSRLCTYALMHLHVCVLRLDLYYRIPTLFPPVHLCTFTLTCMCITIEPILADTHAFPHTQLCTNVLILFVKNVFEENKRNNRGFRGISAFRSTVSFLQTAGNSFRWKNYSFFAYPECFFLFCGTCALHFCFTNITRVRISTETYNRSQTFGEALDGFFLNKTQFDVRLNLDQFSGWVPLAIPMRFECLWPFLNSVKTNGEFGTKVSYKWRHCAFASVIMSLYITTVYTVTFPGIAPVSPVNVSLCHYFDV